MKQTARIIRNNVPYTLLPDGVTYGEPIHVPTVALVRALPDTPPPCITVGSTGAAVSGSFYWDALSVGTDDGVNFIKLASLVTGRYRPVTVGSGGPPTGAAGTDVTGSYPSGLTVSAVRGTAIGTAGGAHATGRVLRTTGTATADWGALDLANSNATTNQLPLSKLPQSGAVDGYALKWSDASGQYVPAAVGAVGSGTVLPGNVGQSLDTVSGPVAAWVTTRLGTYDDLRAPSVFGLQDPASVVLVQCREDINDGGGGLFAYDASDSATADNDGTVIVGAGGERFKRIFSGAVNIRWFGAKGDSNGTTGSGTNDTAAIQAAYSAVSTGGAVYHPPGRYRIITAISDTVPALLLSTDKVRLFGDGEASIIHVDDNGFHVPAVSSWNALKITGDGCRVEKLTFQGNNSPFGGIVDSDPDTEECIAIEADDVTVDRCNFYNLFGHIIHEVGAQERVNVTNCVMRQCANGLNVNSDYSVQSGNQLEQVNGIEASGSNLQISNNRLTDARGISIGGRTSGSANSHITCTGNIITGCTKSAINCVSASDVTISANEIEDTDEHGIVVTRESSGPGPVPGPAVITGNKVTAGVVGGHGIWVQDGTGTSVVGNRAYAAGGGGIYIEATDVLVDNNVCSGGSGGDIGFNNATRLRLGNTNVLVNGLLGVDGVVGTGTNTFTHYGVEQAVTGTGTTAVERFTTVLRVTANGAVTLVLPSPADVGKFARITIQNHSSQLGTTSVTTSSGTVNGESSLALVGPWQSATFESDVTNWRTTGDYGSVISGSGSPESVVTAGVGTVFQRRNGGAGTTLYIKESGTGNTGWVALATGSDRVPSTRTLTGTTPIRIDGDNSAHDLSANRTISVIEATTEALGVIILTGDLGGTAETPEVQGLYGATVPVGSGLTTGHVLQVSGAAALSYGKVPVLLTETISTPPLFNAAAWSFVTGNNSGLIQSVTAGGDKCAFILDLPEGYTLSDLQVWIQPAGGHGALPATMPLFTLTRVDRNTGVATLIDTETDASASVGAYEAYHSIQMSGLAEVINRATRKYVLNFVAEADANALAGTTIGMITRTVGP